MATATTTSSGKPRFKQELVAELVEDGGARYIDVMDPDSGNIFRFYEVEYALACAMDGERDVAGIMKWAQEELGVTPTQSEVNRVIATLGDLGYLDGAEAGAAKEPIAVSNASDELARGVVVGATRQPSVEAVEDVTLGPSGSSAPATTAAAASLTGNTDLVLGKPGAPTITPVASAPVEDIPLGRSGAGPVPQSDSIPVSTDVSLDLSDNMKIGLGDVKEAVRASRVMSAVEVPKDLLDALEDKKPAVEAKPESKKPEPVVEKKPEPKKPEPVVEKKPVVADKKPVVADKKPEPKKPVVVADKKPVVETKQPVAESKTSPMLVVVLVLVLLAAGGFFVWKYVLNKPAEGTVDTTGSGSAAAMVGSDPGSAAAPMVKPEPEVVTAKLATETPASTDVKPLAANVVESVEDVAGKPVAKGAPIAKMTGAKKLEGDIAELTKAVTREQKAIDDATKAKTDAGANADAAKKADDVIKDKTAEMTKNTDAITAKKAELEKLVVVAPADGTVTFTAAGKVGNRTGDAIATLGQKPVLSATFAFKTGTAPAVGTTVNLAHKADSSTLACTVTDAKPDSIKVACDPTKAKADDEVSYTSATP